MLPWRLQYALLCRIFKGFGRFLGKAKNMSLGKKELYAWDFFVIIGASAMAI